MLVVDVALFGLVGVLAVAVISMSWSVPRAIAESADKLNAKIDTTAAQLNTKIDTTNAILADLRERVAYLEGRANPPPRAV